jgi:transposase-like protein
MPKMSGRRSEEIWRELLARQARGGLSVQAFCRRERLNVNTFYGWRSKLRTRMAVREDVAATSESKTSERSGDFIDLGSLEGGASRYEIRLDLGGGVVLLSRDI